jgi:hypothetical protein
VLEIRNRSTKIRGFTGRFFFFALIQNCYRCDEKKGCINWIAEREQKGAKRRRYLHDVRWNERGTEIRVVAGARVKRRFRFGAYAVMTRCGKQYLIMRRNDV